MIYGLGSIASCVQTKKRYNLNNQNIGFMNLAEVAEVGAIAPNSIVNADCLEVMKFIPDKSIDCIICDLPYG